MNLHLDDKHVLVTGGSKGIGFACAEAFLNEGAKVTLVGRNLDSLAAAANALMQSTRVDRARIHTVSADLQDSVKALDALNDAQETLGHIDILVNSAGAARRTPPDELTPQSWHDAMSAKYFTYIHMMDPAVKRMAQRGAGVIVNVIGAGGKVASPTHLAGGAANAALMLVSAGLAAAYGRQGVRVNAVNPGPTLTDRLKQGLEAEAQLNQITPDEALHRTTQRLALGRLAEPKEIANAVLFLASDQASYVTGVILSMDGASTPMVV